MHKLGKVDGAAAIRVEHGHYSGGERVFGDGRVAQELVAVDDAVVVGVEAEEVVVELVNVGGVEEGGVVG